MKDTITPKSEREAPVDPDGRRANHRPENDQRGDTRMERQGGSAPRLPHERDESSDSQLRREESNRQMGEQAHADATSAQQDTDKGAVMDKLYREKVKGGGSY